MVSNFIGGDQILLGAGSSVEPFWNLYAVHKNPHVLKLLEKYRIGTKEKVSSYLQNSSIQKVISIPEILSFTVEYKGCLQTVISLFMLVIIFIFLKKLKYISSISLFICGKKFIST